MTTRGLFLSFEGLDGAGKSTQIARLARRLEQQGYEVVRTVEPGGTRIGQAIRAILLAPEHTEMDMRTELLLYFAARAQNLNQVILPAVERGAIVLCDRYTDSTIAYQGGARGLGEATVREVHRIACRDVWPDRTLCLDISAEVSETRRGQDRMEQNDRAFFQAIREAFHGLAQSEPERVRLIDASGSLQEVEAAIWREVEPLLPSQI